MWAWARETRPNLDPEKVYSPSILDSTEPKRETSIGSEDSIEEAIRDETSHLESGDGRQLEYRICSTVLKIFPVASFSLCFRDQREFRLIEGGKGISAQLKTDGRQKNDCQRQC